MRTAPFLRFMIGIINDPKFVVEIEIPKVHIIISPPTKGDYNLMIQGAFSANEYIEKYGTCDELPPLTESTADKFIDDVIEVLKKYRDKNIDVLGVPKKNDYSIGEDNKSEFPILTHADNLVYIHSGLNFVQQRDISIIEYWLLLADAVKLRLSETEKGREYLQDCYVDMHSQTAERVQGVI